jgi:two-component system CheB/CheR fusion protein
MQVFQIDDPSVFYEKLKREPVEIDFLFQDLLIGVTSFFRDSEQFQALEEEVIPKLFEGKGPDDVVRVWVPGCSTGEEAYSIAMLLREHSQKNHSAPKLQIFASDIDERALEIARMGRYPATVAENVSPKRLRQFFSREDGTYRITSDLREMCLFSPHNMLRDPPFSRLDLISCRNLLIYLGAELQERARAATRLPEFPLTARVRVPAANRTPEAVNRSSFQDLAERELLNRYAPAYVIVTDAGELMHSSSGTGKYLELPQGSPDHNVLTMARTGLRLHLSAILQRSVSTGRPAMQKDITVGTNGAAVRCLIWPSSRYGAMATLSTWSCSAIRAGSSRNGTMNWRKPRKT